jgi:Icc-related predicted phosphoesterase
MKAMKILAISDLHGDLGCVHKALDHFGPDLLLSCGDWGDPDQVTDADLATFPARVMVLSTFGNHDALDRLARLRNRDGSEVLMGQAEIRAVGGLRIAAIGGIWAKAHKKRHYVTDEDVAEMAEKIARTGSVDVLLTHGCPVGLADLTPSGRHGGQRCFLLAFQKVAPRLHLCGHLHVAQERTLKDGRQVVNIGATPDGSVVVIEVDGNNLVVRRESFLPH